MTKEPPKRLTLEEALKLGREHQFHGRLHQAEIIYRQILARQPNQPDALHMLGLLAYQAGHAKPGIDLIKKAMSIAPTNADLFGTLGLIQIQMGDFEQAVASCREAIRLRPSFPDAYNNLGNAFFGLARLEESIEAYKQALKLKPDYPEVYSNIGNVLFEAGQPQAAISACKSAIAMRPLFTDAHYNLGNAYYGEHMLETAIHAYRQCIAINPNSPKAYNNLGNALKDNGYVDEAILCYEQSSALSHMFTVESNRVYLLQFHPRYDAAEILTQTKKWNERYAVPMRQHWPKHENTREPERKLRIGYVSPDLRDHVVGRNILPLVQHHDRENFEVFCYSNVTREDFYSKKFRDAADQWRPISSLSDKAASELIVGDKIDILVDLALHMASHRLTLMACKPAPVQVTFGGYPGTTGMDAIDYRLTDPYLDPPGEMDQNYSEKSIRLPHSFWCYDAEAMEAGDYDPGPLPALANGYVTFGCLNNFCKVNDLVLELWARVMREVENSRLLVLTPPGPPRIRVGDKLEREGIDPKRVDFFERLRDRPRYMQEYRRIDLGLDTFPYNGHTTSLDSLWMCVPVVTLLGKTVVGRAGWSQLCNLNLKDLAANSPDEFVSIAVKLARDTERLKELRTALRQRMRESPLCDAAGFTHGIEAAYRDMWRKYCIS